MSCEKYVGALKELESNLNGESEGHFMARSIAGWLRESCEGLAGRENIHTSAVMREHRYLGLSKQQARENDARDIRDQLIKDAIKLLSAYGIEMDP